MRFKLIVTLCFLALICLGQAAEPMLAFPTAEGFGRHAEGGRGGKVLFVTHLRDDGPGSLRAAIEYPEPRTVIFRVGGTIELESPLRITHPYITIAGQTAPGDGICLRKYPLMISADHSVVRYLRVRLGDEAGKLMDGMDISHASHVIVDHCSVSWTLDEGVNTYHGTHDATIQWCLISESLDDSPLRNGHGFAASLGGQHTSYHHNLFANNAGRNPSIAGETRDPTVALDFRNNAIFNWKKRRLDGRPESINVINNYYKAGPASEQLQNIVKMQCLDNGEFGRWHVSGNVLDRYGALIRGEELVIIDDPDHVPSFALAEQPLEVAPVRTEPAEVAFEKILKRAGAIRPARDSHDARIVREALSGKTTFGNGIISSQSQVGGWPELRGGQALKDADLDGMPDAWERRFSPNQGLEMNASDDLDGDGYTNLEEYLNQTHPNQKG